MVSLKCENCGAIMNLANSKKILYCPYCGAAFVQPETAADLERFRIKHAEKGRQRKFAEMQIEEKKGHKYRLLIMILLIVLVGTPFIIHKIDDIRLDRLVTEIRTDILDGRYDEAELKIVQLKPGEWSWDNDNKWRKTREELQQQIEERRR